MWTMKSLCHDVRQHQSRFAVFELDLTALDLITDVRVFDVDMLGTAMVEGIRCHLDARLIVFADDKLRSFLVGSFYNLAQ